MPKLNATTEAVREAKFIQGIAEGKTAKDAYKAVNPLVTDRSAEVLGSRALSKVEHEDINELYKRIGCTKDVVLAELFKRMQKTRKDGDFAKMTNILAKIGGWEDKSNPLARLLHNDMDLVEIIKIRLSKRSNTKPLDKVIDVDNSSTNKQ
jgi:hypothetical protein